MFEHGVEINCTCWRLKAGIFRDRIRDTLQIAIQMARQMARTAFRCKRQCLAHLLLVGLMNQGRQENNIAFPVKTAAGM